MRKTVEYTGFTLLEVLVVLIILGILAVVAVPYYLDVQKEAKISVVKGKVAAIRGGIELAHAKIIMSGVNTGPDGTNPDWPTLPEVQANKLFLDTRPSSIRNRKLVRSDNNVDEPNNALPHCMLPEMTMDMSSGPAAVSGKSLEDISHNPRRADETSCWAYYPGNERDADGRVVEAVFYVNDDRALTDNVDGDRVPSSW